MHGLQTVQGHHAGTAVSLLDHAIRAAALQRARQLEELAVEGCAFCGKKPVTEMETIINGNQEAVRFRCNDHSLLAGRAADVLNTLDHES